MNGLAYGGAPQQQQQHSRFTRLSKLVTGVLLLLCAATSIFPATRAYLALVPGRTLPCVWNLLTASFVTSNPLKALAEAAALLLLARVVEPVYGSAEFLRLLVVVAASSSAATFVGVYLWYLATPSKDGKVLYTQFSGFHGVIGGLLVAGKQIMADQDIAIAGALRLPARYVPSAYVLAGTLLAAGLRTWTPLAFLLLGPYCCWVYLRFFQWQPETLLRGDPSEDFRFSTFFPDFMSGPLDVVGRVLSTVLCLRHSPEAVAAASGGPGAGLEARPLLAPGGGLGLGMQPLEADGSEASRRRERGAKALEERLMAGKAAAAAAAGNGSGGALDRMETGGGGGSGLQQR